jgi:hypothetical protein
MGNFRGDIAELEAAKDHARAIGLELNTHVAFAPYCDTAGVPSARDIAKNFKRLLTYLSIWTRRHIGARFTYIRVAHSADDGTGQNPHLHILLHLPDAKHRDELQVDLTAIYGYTAASALIVKVCSGTDKRVRHESGFYGSTFDYLTRHKTQQAFVAGGRKTWRASRRDQNGRHRGLKCPFTGRRWATSHNINVRARQAHDEVKGRKIVSARIAAERKHLAARGCPRETHLACATAMQSRGE